MKRNWFVVMLALATAAPVAAAPDTGAPPGVWAIGPRILPLPVHASEALRKAIKATPTPDPAKALAATPRSLEEWRADIAANRGSDAVVAAFAERFGVTITPDRIAGVPVYHVKPKQVARAFRDKLFVYIHGGAFIKGGGPASSFEAMQIAGKLGIPAISIDYRMAPDHPAPAASDDTLAVYRALLGQRPAASMAMGGTSAGANLVLVTNLKAKAAGLPLPAALMVGTPPVDLAKTTDTRFLMEGVDRYLPSWDAEPAGAMALYAAGQDLRDPILSPIHGDVSGFPPTYLITGTRDMMLSDTALMHRKLRRAGVAADLYVIEGHSHGDYAIMVGTPEADEHHGNLDTFLRAAFERSGKS